MKVDVDGGKYTIVHPAGGNLHILRHGEQWLVNPLGEKCWIAIADELLRLREENRQLRDHKSALEISVAGLRQEQIGASVDVKCLDWLNSHGTMDVYRASKDPDVLAGKKPPWRWKRSAGETIAFFDIRTTVLSAMHGRDITKDRT